MTSARQVSLVRRGGNWGKVAISSQSPLKSSVSHPRFGIAIRQNWSLATNDATLEKIQDQFKSGSPALVRPVQNKVRTAGSHEPAMEYSYIIYRTSSSVLISILSTIDMVVEEWESRTAAQRSRMTPIPQTDRATGASSGEYACGEGQ